MADLDTLRANLKRAQDELAEAEQLAADFESLPPEKKLAEHLHGKFCHWNHTDGCSWEYQNSLDPRSWEQITRRQYLATAEELLGLLDGDLDLAFRVASTLGRG